MITLPTRITPYRVLGIDNGSTRIGTTVMDLDLNTGKVLVRSCESFLAAKTAGRYIQYGEHASRFARMVAIREYLRESLAQWTPDIVLIESPFLNRRMPESFAVLRESLILIKLSIMEDKPGLPIEDVSPRSAKVSAGVDLKRKGKEPVIEAVRKLPIDYAPGIDIEQLDDDAVDSIIIAYYKAIEVYTAYKAGIK